MTSRLLLRGACLAATLAFLAPPSITRADTTYQFQGTTTGVFTNPTTNPGYNGTLAGVNSASFSWEGQQGNQSWLKYTGASPDFNIQANAIPSAPFILGTLIYHNGNNNENVEIVSVDLEITLTLTVPTTNEGLDPVELRLTGRVASGADKIEIHSVFDDVSFTVAGVEYTLNMLGFGTYNSNAQTFTFVDELAASKNGEASAQLWGKVTAVPVTSTDPPAVPEPASIAVVAVAGLLGLAHAARRRVARA